MSSVRHVLLGVTGGIAAYKSAELVRRLQQRGFEVQVVMTRGAKEFVTELTFQALSGKPVRSNLWDHHAEAAMGHIELARWADQIIVAPASADFIARLAHGFADDLLSTLCLATKAPISIAPAMNHVMWNNPATQSNITLLKQRGIRVLGPGAGDQACGETGLGRMLEPEQIAAQLIADTSCAGNVSSFAGLKVVVTAGPTREKIDPVRFITNRSSGKMGFAVAAALRCAGANVVLISGPVSLPTPDDVTRINVESAEQMLQAVQQHIGDAQLFVATAAVSDYRAAKVAEQKIKKGNESLQLELARTPDILATVAASKQRPFLVGFAAETENVEANALKKLQGKSLDMIAANKFGDGLAFDCDENALTVYWQDGKQELCKCSKSDLAKQLVQLIGEHLDRRSKPASSKQQS